MKKMLMSKFSKNALSIDFQKKIVGGGEWCGWTGTVPQYCSGECWIQLNCPACATGSAAIVCSTSDFEPVCAIT